MATRNTTKASASVSSKVSTAKAKLVFGFLNKTLDTVVAISKVNATVIKSLPITEEHMAKAQEIQTKSVDFVIESQKKFEDFAYDMLNSETAKECASRIAIAATDRMIRMMETAPLPHERNAREDIVSPSFEEANV